jgi:type III pantothenate kinase
MTYEMISLCIDIGNTQTKIAVFRDLEITEFRILENNNYGQIADLLSVKKIEAAILSSVAVVPDSLVALLKERLAWFWILDHTLPIPIDNLYETKETLGKDRLAAVIGANSIYPKDDVLVIDAGTAITYDIISRNGQYLGGNIAPGIRMRFNALHHFTSRLPKLEMNDHFPLFGKNTTEAITSGVQQGILMEVDGTINLFRQSFPDLVVLFTGGDAKFFDNRLKSAIFVVSNLVMIGLNRVLVYNVKKTT